MRFSFATTLAIATTCLATNLTARCHSDIINFPNIPGTHNVKVVASAAENFQIEAENSQSSKVQYTTLSFCNVTIRYGHQDWHDDIAVSVWLPLEG
ncbi:putative feruloyl esterase [Fusarium bulbicola]|nr:putative feruloyl esterase [Fusarium bulbicola]